MGNRSFVVCALLALANASSAADGVEWVPSIEKARSIAAGRKALVLVAVVAGGEALSEAQKGVFDDPEFVKASRECVCVLADSRGTPEQKRAWFEAMARYLAHLADPEGEPRLPCILLLDPAGRVVRKVAKAGVAAAPAGDLVRALQEARRGGRSAHGVCLPPEDREPETIDHEDPDRYARIPASAGDRKRIEAIAKDLKTADPERTLRRIHAFIADRVPRVPSRGWGPHHRNFDDLLTGFDHRGCSSHGLLFASLARACGIPVVYIKTMRHSWIQTFTATGETGSFSGHVFLEVFLVGTWKLLDAQGMRIWDDYDPGDPELPGGLLAYEKGWDHVAMVHSTQRDRYIAEDVARWRGFDTARLRKNDAPGRSLLPKLFAITLAGEWRAISDRLPRHPTFDRYHWPEFREKVKGNVFIVTAIGGRTELPEEDAEEWLPVSLAKLRAEAKAGTSAVHSGTVENGTRVLVLAAPGRNELMQLIWRVDLNRLVCDLAR